MQSHKCSGCLFVRVLLMAAALAIVGACGGGGGGAVAESGGGSTINLPLSEGTGGAATGGTTTTGGSTAGGPSTTGTGSVPVATSPARLRTDEFLVGGAAAQVGEPVIARLQGGDFVVAWESATPTTHEILLQRLDAAGNPAGPASRVDTLPTTEVYPYYVTTPAVAALADGGYIVVWSSFNTTDWDVHARRFNSTGNPAGGERVINSVTSESLAGTQFQSRQSVAGLNDGGYIIMWTSRPSPAGFDLSIAEMARFDASDHVVLAGHAEGGGNGPDVFEDAATVALYSGGYLMTWSLSNIITQMRLDAGNVPIGGKTVVGSGTGFVVARLAALWDGGWIVTIINGITIYTYRFDSAGKRVGDAMPVNTTAAAESSAAPVVGLPDGGYVVTWQSASTAAGTDIYAQRFDAQGRKVGAEILVNTTKAGNQTGPDIEGDNLGGFIITWLTLDGDQRGIHARGFVP